MSFLRLVWVTTAWQSVMSVWALDEVGSMRPWILKREIEARIALYRGALRQAHRLPSPLQVSVKSHPPRYKYLRQALLSLLAQDVRPDGVHLWIEHQHLAQLPAGVRALQRLGLAIRPCENGLRSYGKIVPALEQYPTAYIATADDDHIYPPDWLSKLAAAAGPDTIAYHRGHRMRFAPDGSPMPYEAWDREIDGQVEGDIVLPTGVGGILYPPSALDPRVIERHLFQALAPTSDDLWLFWMAQLRGTGFRKAASTALPETLPTSSIASLFSINNPEQTGNDLAIRALVAAFGLPRS